ncbi:2-nitropropane dioxygenase NPD [Papiliotrema laurentii]|uniref:2-nitropropane dioxygenase NPD n=1 Tax=Papiliotrema laurentii TaxID=5418 RepID=A0AAD9CT98_PAPLA|nr:2-nitropropane dioxygenase NPD [Papiliotrema laurentii]
MSILRQLNVRLPIVQAPMAGTSTPQMAAAVSNAGGLGSIALGAGDASAAQEAIRRVRQLTDKAFNVNLFVHRPAVSEPDVCRNWIDHLRPTFESLDAQPPESLKEIYKTFDGYQDMLDILLANQLPLVSFHFGLPSPEFIAALKSKGTKLFASVTSLEEAKQAEEAGIDCLVAQGYEAGGHRGVFDDKGADDQLSTFALVQLLVAHSSLPVIAAGGIMTGQGIRAVLGLGAIAAQLGTAFVLTSESAADEAYRAAMRSTAARHTVMTAAISGRPARCLANKFTSLPVVGRIPDYPLTYDIGKALNAAAKAKGDGGYGAQWAGQGAPLAREMSCEDLIKTLEREMGA